MWHDAAIHENAVLPTLEHFKAFLEARSCVPPRATENSKFGNKESAESA